MAAYTDARASLQSAITAAKTYLAARDQPANLQDAFAVLIQIRDTMNQWVRAEIALATLDADEDSEIVGGLAAERIKDLRQDGQKLLELGKQISDLVVLIAGKARA